MKMKLKPFRRDRAKQAKREGKRRPINVLASAMTTVSLYCGVASVFASIGSELEKASLFILIAIIFDALDGTVARLTKSTSEFGKELDSLSDMVSFGVAPAVLVFVTYLPASAHLAMLSARTESIVGKSGSYMAIIYVICAALRLARFNIFQSERRDSFVGLPSPAAGGTIASFVLFLQYFEPSLETMRLGPLASMVLGPLAILLALLMVSTVRYPKDRFKHFIVAPRHAIVALGMVALFILAVHSAVARSPYIVLFPLGMSYVLFGIGDTFYARYLERRLKRTQEASTDQEGGAPSVKSGERL
jgi:CDP-diacylglycerol--serine O-phosphatidyltransferase